MNIIPLSDEFLPSVLDGSKISTICRGRRPYQLGEGLLRVSDQYIPVEIQNIRYSSFQDLSEEDAWQDGLRTLNELRSTLRRFYPQMRQDDDVTIVEFSLRGN